MLNLLLGHHLEAHEVGDAEGGRHRDVGCVAAASHDYAAYARMVVTRVFVYHRPARKTSNQALKSIGLTSIGTPMSPR